MYEQHDYDYAGRVSTLTNKLTSSSNYSTHTYTYDNSGNIKTKSENIQGSSKTTTYAYDTMELKVFRMRMYFINNKERK